MIVPLALTITRGCTRGPPPPLWGWRHVVAGKGASPFVPSQSPATRCTAAAAASGRALAAW
eukprot:CAMPEP_0174363726 /NCGR_PEP_ID=MMETSP0811_2-20130205/69950_1 /TAXON_ID=73025 ORGANISM="Eutreptiella gymnastica-like, Strain CCMP1594" /NCGR_SAMPLE_ID=MMETSP0811_2 /ASSEMBLY_ACC=CAM_ASM_000667 /LENGTH=60 /DNA_ID=CAMNT_0015502661 /DNA_START=96 /DNA_END=275 /DNA_ORIENTATION=+